MMNIPNSTIIGTNCSFWELLNEYKVEIPIIQRDYAQGRNTKFAQNIRDAFVENIYNAIYKDEKLELDFIYASLVREGVLEPIDGQQRLTTLFLLHWYLAVKENQDSYVMDILKKFTYETRSSSKSFCEKLCDNHNIKLDTAMKLSETIENSSWFILAWKHDPTVMAMLTMLDKLNEVFGRNETAYFSNLIGENSPLTFQFLKITEFDDTEDLYIKMNARGKRLTDFENFKAQFGKFLNEKSSQQAKSLFWNNVDSKWSNNFWMYLKEREGEAWDYQIDSKALHFIWFQVELLYLINENNSDVGKSDGSSIFYESKSQKIAYNYKILESAISTEQKLGGLLYSEFIVSSLKLFNQTIKGMAILQHKLNFWDNENIFALSMPNADQENNNKFEYFPKIMLFLALAWCNINDGFPSEEPFINFIDFMRIARNSFQRCRVVRRDAQAGTYNTQLRFRDLNKPLRFFTDKFLNDISINPYDILLNLSDDELRSNFPQLAEEKSKAEFIRKGFVCKSEIHSIEDHPLIRGTLRNMLSDDGKLLFSYDEINSMWNTVECKKDNLIWRAILACAPDFRLQISDEKVRFNAKEDNYVIVFLTKDNDILRDSYIAFNKEFRKCKADNPGFTISQILQTIIDGYLSGSNLFINELEQWSFYCVKYPMLTNGQNIFHWNKEIPFESRIIDKGYLLTRPHMNTISSILLYDDNVKDKIDIESSWVRGAEYAPLKMKNGISIYCNNAGWRLDFSECNKQELKADVCEKYTTILANEKIDRIEAIKEALNELLDVE